jgi:hypothetical protein
VVCAFVLQVEKVWSLMREWLQKWATWKNGKFSDLSVKDLDGQAQNFQKTLQKSFPRGVKQWKVWRSLFGIIQQFRQTMPLITDLRSNVSLMSACSCCRLCSSACFSCACRRCVLATGSSCRKKSSSSSTRTYANLLARFAAVLTVFCAG